MSTKTESPVNRFPNAHAHNEDEVVAIASAPPPDADCTCAGLPTDGLPKNKEDLVIRPPRMRGTSRGSLDSRFTGTVGRIIDSYRSPTIVCRHVTLRWETKACVHSSYYFETSSRPLQLLLIKPIWRRLALSLLLLLPTTLLLNMLDDELGSVASVMSINNFNMVIGFIVATFGIFVAWFAKGNCYTRIKGLSHAVDGYHVLDSTWEAIYEKCDKAYTDEEMVQAKREIDSAITKLQKKKRDLSKLKRWEMLTSLYAGTSVVHAYEEHKERLDLIFKFFVLTAKRRGTHFPPPPEPIEV
ncbi:hypothetical protein B0H11DRAFT_1924820 [Mycena galericulata]|nr:hypothetical protein B0H11DRAFT_1924820 [Mycena galericulata]